MKIKPASTTIVLLAFIVLSSCAEQQTRSKSSVVDYLYPKQSETIITPSTPTLTLPLRVGIAFVPEGETSYMSRNAWTGARGNGAALTSVMKQELLEKVADRFRSLEFVSEIEVIPTEYLTPGGSFDNLEQIQTMYGIDVVALVSYDQVQFTDEGFLSLTYWTIVGAYVVHGEMNDTNTMIDTVVYDIKSRKMLFRAPGTSTVKGGATPVNLSLELREDSVEGFNIAAEKMSENLKTQLDAFKKKIKDKPEQVNIVHSEGYTGNGTLSVSLIAMIALCTFGIRKLTNHSTRAR